jgi:eukaryotic-like serine/threonine-protein kinase
MSAIEQLATSTPSTVHGTILGTVQYMAPEQVEGKAADARSDIWALGAVIHETVTGTRPFRGDTPASIIGAILRDDPPPISRVQPQAPPLLDHIVTRCLAKDPDDRWQSARDLRTALD